MECEQFRRTLPDFFSEDLPAAPSDEATLHMSSCHACRGIYEGLVRVNAAMKAEKLKEVPPYSGTRIMQYLENHLERPVAILVFPLPVWIRSAALLCAVVTGIIMGFHRASGFDLPTGTGSNPDSIEALRTELYLSSFTDENILIDLTK